MKNYLSFYLEIMSTLNNSPIEHQFKSLSTRINTKISHLQYCTNSPHTVITPRLG